MARSQINHNMVTLARQLRGLTQTELSRKLGISQGKISKIEQGFLGVDKDVFSKLVKFLNFPRGFFTQTGQLFPAEISLYRKKQSLPKKDSDYINALLNYKYRALLKLLESIEVETNIPFLDIADYDNPKEIAKVLRNYWKIPKGSIENLTGWVEKSGIFVLYIDVPTNKFDGIRFNADTNVPIIALNRSMPPDRIRFSLAHELGHIIMHRLLTPTADDEAMIFASEFLVPSTEIIFPSGKLRLSDFADLKRYWKVSMAALIFKAKELDKLTDSQYRYLWQQMAKLGYKMCEPGTLNPPVEEPTLIKEIIKLHLDELGYDKNELKGLLALNEKDFEELWRPYIPGYKKPQFKLTMGGLSEA